jgi:hypothetical protein
MQFLHCAAHLPLIANYREPATWQASPICRLKRKLSPNFKGTVQLQSNNFYIVLRTLLYVQNMSGTSHTLARQSLTIAVAMSLCPKEIISQKSPDSSQTCRSHLSPHPGILPPQVAKQLHKNAQLNLQNIYFNQPSLNLCTSLPHCLNIYKTL